MEIEAQTPALPLSNLGRDALLGGVCVKLARRSGKDAGRVRLLFALATLLTGSFPGVIAYLLLYALLPDND